MKRLFGITMFVSVIIGTFAIALMFIFKSNSMITFITRERIEETQIWIYKYDFESYIKAIRNTLQTPELELSLPTRTWSWSFPDGLLNDLALMVDVFILVGNVLLYPLRIGALVVRIILVFIGIDVVNSTSANPLNWLVQLLSSLNNAQMTYI